MLERDPYNQPRLHMNQTTLAPTPLDSLLISLAKDVGLEHRLEGSQSLVLEFEAPPHTCRVMPHPADSDRLVIEVMVRYLGESAQDLTRDSALLIHRLNAQARVEHDWVATVDESDHLVIWLTLEIARTRVPDLQAWLVEGIERAQALNALWEGDRSPPESDLGADLRARFTGLKG